MDNRFQNENYADLIIDSDSIYAKNNPNDVIYINPRFSLITVPIAEINKCSVGIYNYHNFPKIYVLESLSSLEESGITTIQNNPVFGLRGQGVLIGIVDTGIDYRHEVFKNSNGTTKILSLWDQTVAAESPEEETAGEENVVFGAEYTKEMINSALNSPNPLEVVPSVDENGHGTMIAGIIAGNESINNNFRGVVPNSELIVVKLKQSKKITRDMFSIPQEVVCFQESDIMLGVNYIINTAQKAGRPVAICIAMGTSMGGHDGRGPLSSYLSYYTDTLRTVIVISGGNEGSARRHYLGHISRQTYTVDFELNVGPDEAGFSMEIWQNTPHRLSIEATSPSGERINPVFPSRGECQRISLIFERTIIYINNFILEALSGDQLILVRFEYPTEGIWRFRMRNLDNLESDFHVWLPAGNLITPNTYLLNSDPNITLTSPANGVYPITVTAFNHENDSIWINSSRGYTRVGVIKPDLAAPGVNLTCPITGGGYGTITGTGAASAHTTGIAAMMLEWGVVRGNYPTIHGTEIRQSLIRGARRDPQLVYPNNIWGYGIVDVLGTFESLR